MPADLEKYRAKRNFSRTPEPSGEAAARVSERPQFVVQKHDARRLHYDFRLEHDGVLKSWAVPKGPSLDPQERRLAVQTEDHPLEYATFEGVIPEREYGAGAVLVWDRGHWVPDGDPSEALAKGKLDFTLHGEKLRGRWTLVRLAKRAGRRDDKDNWLLIKRRDAAAQPDGAPELVDTRPESVLTGRSIEAVAADRDRVWNSSDGEPERPPTAEVGRPETIPGARRRPLPRRQIAQRPEDADETPDGPGWLHEPEWLGARLLCRVDHGAVAIRGADGRAAAPAFAAVEGVLAALPCSAALVDGVAVVFDEHGRTDRRLLEQAARDGASNEIVLVAIDLLHLDGWDLRGAALRARKELLRLLLTDAAPGIRYGDHVEGHGADFFREACRVGLHGVVSKRADAKYRGGTSGEWLRVRCRARKHARGRSRRAP